MTFLKSGKFYIVARHDSFLAVELIVSKLIVEPVVKTLPSNHNFGNNNKLNPEKVLEEVEKGLKTANQLFSTDYQVKELHYIEDDARPESLYGDMMKKLIQHLSDGSLLVEFDYKFR